jgi:hypothetical protein
MNRHSVSKVIVPKWFAVCVSLILPVILWSCVAGMHMIAKEGKPSISAKADKSVLVIIRTTSFGWGNVVDNYLDGKMIGQTQGKMFFITEVTPGVHYIMSHADNTDTARLKFEAGKIYLLQQGIYPGWNIVTRFSPMTTEEFAKEVQEASFVVYDTQRPGKDMSDKDLKEAKDDFEKEVKQGEHKDILQIKGYTRLK